MASDERRISVRLPKELRERLEAEACEKWNGNMSYTVLRALRDYFGMVQENPPELSAPIRFRAAAERKRLAKPLCGKFMAFRFGRERKCDLPANHEAECHEGE